ncbi:MAG: hypothetical protein IKO92_04780, partial [Clostridia bacterium]|nr:hypothetical protein [Clostridia bacterium]
HRKVEIPLRHGPLADEEREGPHRRVGITEGKLRPAIALQGVELVDALPIEESSASGSVAVEYS